MFDNDQMTESAELRALRDSVNAVAMPERRRSRRSWPGDGHTGGTGAPESRASSWPAPPQAPH